MRKIADYGLIGDARACALVSRAGSIDWCCFPRFDSPSCFAALLDPEAGGRFAVSPDVAFCATQRYLEGTNVLETRFECASGEAVLTDLFSVADEKTKRSMLWPDHEILRVIQGVEGTVPLVVRFEPRARYGEQGLRFRKIGDWGLLATIGRERLVLQASVDISRFWIRSRADGDEAILELKIRGGQCAVFSLTHAAEAPAVIPALGTPAQARYEETVRYWRRWIARCRYSGFAAPLVRRSALALKLLTYAPSGAVVAAATTSLPEERGGVRNWDYRFCWLRDASFTVRALLDLGYGEEAQAYVDWLMHTTRLTRPRLQVVYSVYGRSDLPERELSWLRGYARSRPVRCGNEASCQSQLDVYGEVIEAFRHVMPYVGAIDRESRELLIGMARLVREAWRQPDDGIWEFRSQRAHHTHSKVLCWVALDRVSRMARERGWKLPADMAGEAALVRREIERRGFSARLGAYTRAFGEDELDAALLVMPIVGYARPDDPRVEGTIAAIQRHLSRDRLVYRYRPGSDALAGTEGAFGICSFWMAEALSLAGRTGEALEWFEAVAARANGSGLFSEELDPESGDFLGNYPQAFTHIGLINAALALDRALARREARSA